MSLLRSLPMASSYLNAASSPICGIKGGDTEGACKIEGRQSSIANCFACEEEIGCGDCCCCAALKSKRVRFAESTEDWYFLVRVADEALWEGSEVLSRLVIQLF